MAHKTAWLACAAAAWLAAAPSTAQTPSAERPAPRTADGKPDLTGIWVATGAILLFEGEEAFRAARAADAGDNRE